MSERKIVLVGAWIITCIGVCLILLSCIVWQDVNGFPIPIEKRITGILYGLGILLGSILMHLEAKFNKGR